MVSVLIVDDHAPFRATVRALLDGDGFDVVCEAEDGESALIAVEEMKPDLVLLDVQLPSHAVLTSSVAVFTNMAPAALKDLVPRISPRAVFFIYGEHGQGGSERAPNQGFYAEAGEPKAIWEVPGAQHVGGITTRPAEYERRVIAFFDRTLLR